MSASKKRTKKDAVTIQDLDGDSDASDSDYNPESGPCYVTAPFVNNTAYNDVTLYHQTPRRTKMKWWRNR